MVACEVQTKHQFGNRPWLSFSPVTMVPLGRNLIDPLLLSDVEVEWVNSYHAEVWEKTAGFFKDDALALNWLQRETQPIGK